MSGQALIDGLKFAREQQCLHGELEIAALPRLEDELFERSGKVSFTLAGSIDRHGKPVLAVEVRGTLVLRCQRCLGRFDYELARKSRLVLAAPGQRLPEVGEEDPETEAVPAESVGDIADLIEQEVLLGLPIAPAHAEGSCSTDAAVTTDRPASPFAALAKLKSP